MDDCTSATSLFMCFLTISAAIHSYNNISLTMFLLLVHKIFVALYLELKYIGNILSGTDLDQILLVDAWEHTVYCTKVDMTNRLLDTGLYQLLVI